VRAVLGETFRLLGSHLHLFTLISLTVWLPTHVVLNYLEFFDPGEDSAGRALRIVLTAQVVLDPFVASALLSALARIKQGAPVSYWQALAEGFSAWPRLMLVRFVAIWVLLLPSLGWLAVYTGGPALKLAGGGILIALALTILVLLVRFALVDSVVVLGGASLFSAWRQAAELTAGQRWSILWTATVLFTLIFGLALAGEHLDQFLLAVARHAGDARFLAYGEPEPEAVAVAAEMDSSDHVIADGGSLRRLLDVGVRCSENECDVDAHRMTPPGLAASSAAELAAPTSRPVASTNNASRQAGCLRACRAR